MPYLHITCGCLRQPVPPQMVPDAYVLANEANPSGWSAEPVPSLD